MALNAKVEDRILNGNRTVPIEKFYIRTPSKNVLAGKHPFALQSSAWIEDRSTPCPGSKACFPEAKEREVFSDCAPSSAWRSSLRSTGNAVTIPALFSVESLLILACSSAEAALKGDGIKEKDGHRACKAAVDESEAS